MDAQANEPSDGEAHARLRETDDPLTTRITESLCPYCDGKLDAASHMTEEIRPKPGDLTVCLYCAQELIFDAFLALRKPVLGEVEAMFLDDPVFADEVRGIQRAIRNLDRRDSLGMKQ